MMVLASFRAVVFCTLNLLRTQRHVKQRHHRVCVCAWQIGWLYRYDCEAIIMVILKQLPEEPEYFIGGLLDSIDYFGGSFGSFQHIWGPAGTPQLARGSAALRLG